MKTLVSSILAIMMICPALADKPKISIYHIIKMDQNNPSGQYPEVIFEISNPTKKIYYFRGSSISSPAYRTEVVRKGKWLIAPNRFCGTGNRMYPLKPGAKLLVSPSILWEEKEFRFRYYFSLDPKLNPQIVAKHTELVSPAITKTQLGDFKGTIGEIPLEEVGDETKK